VWWQAATYRRLPSRDTSACARALSLGNRPLAPCEAQQRGWSCSKAVVELMSTV